MMDFFQGWGLLAFSVIVGFFGLVNFGLSLYVAYLKDEEEGK